MTTAKEWLEKYPIWIFYLTDWDTGSKDRAELERRIKEIQEDALDSVKKEDLL